VTVRVLVGDALSVLRTLESESVNCVVTSPPYYGLRSYGTEPQVWGGDVEHEHEWGDIQRAPGWVSNNGQGATSLQGHGGDGKSPYLDQVHAETKQRSGGAFCPCGAWRGELGSEPTPGLFIEHLLLIFDEVKRVLRKDGLAFVNLGDSRSGSGKGPTGHNGIGNQERRQGFHDGQAYRAIPPKNLLLTPQRFAIGMQDRGWIVRDCIVWAKTSAMPESVRDRPTSAWEPIWMFAKSRAYFWDQEAVRQPHARLWASNNGGTMAKVDHDAAESGRVHQGQNHRGPYPLPNAAGANLRNVWTLGPEPSREEHYAAFPTEIPRRCILAGTSEKGACPACGAGWVRSTSTRYENPGNRTNNGTKYADQKRVVGGNAGYAVRLEKRVETTGWQPGCACDAGPPIPQTVLDPFLGSGTTLMVADRLGRDGVGIELSPTYAEMARKRIESDAGSLFGETVAVEAPQQGGLFDTEGAG
jgi:DNA modification methylase